MSVDQINQITENRFSVSTEEAGKIIGLSKAWVIKRIISKEIPSFKVGTRRLIRVSDLVGYIESKRQEYIEEQKILEVA